MGRPRRNDVLAALPRACERCGDRPDRHDIAVGSGDAAQVAVNGRTLFQSLTPVARASASAFGAHGEGEITGLLMANALPDAQQAHDDTGLAAGQLGYDVALAPGATQDIVIAFALGDAEQARPVEARDLQNGVPGREHIVDDDLRRHLVRRA